MRFKYIFLSLMLLILVGSMTAIAAEDDYASLGDYTFDIPEGYQIADEADNMLAFEADDDHSVIVYALDSVSDLDIFKSLLDNQGCKFADETSFESGSFNVDQSTYSYMDTKGYMYICDDGSGTPVLVALGIPDSEDLPQADDNPAYQVVSSLE
ncbi:hypothetical protein [Methanobrevibacter sp.]|uniref:hypothetical protein n=1 Tax=Methanobrevibacter sp. TaxID=66852 RepID=UPI0025E92D68|nr:hypothetical protein [Methanobrevibacter sp.]MBQ2961598.1 hypothetical protein [Methanobrevibacter sp.]